MPSLDLAKSLRLARRLQDACEAADGTAIARLAPRAATTLCQAAARLRTLDVAIEREIRAHLLVELEERGVAFAKDIAKDVARDTARRLIRTCQETPSKRAGTKCLEVKPTRLVGEEWRRAWRPARRDLVEFAFAG